MADNGSSAGSMSSKGSLLEDGAKEVSAMHAIEGTEILLTTQKNSAQKKGSPGTYSRMHFDCPGDSCDGMNVYTGSPGIPRSKRMGTRLFVETVDEEGKSDSDDGDDGGLLTPIHKEVSTIL